MNRKVVFIILLGIFSIATLAYIPPWKAYGKYVGHFRIDRVAFLTLDFKRFLIEEFLIMLISVSLAIKVWGKRKRN